MHFITDEAALQQLLTTVALPWLLLVVAASLVILSKGADWMVDGVVFLAQRTGLPRIVIGATIVSLGTTTPEAVVSVTAAFMGNSGLALGNGVGSIIVDTGLIFGFSCIIGRIPIQRFVLNRTGWVQVGAATLLVLLAVGVLFFSQGPAVLPRWMGLLLVALLIAYLFTAYWWARQGAAVSEGITRAADTEQKPLVFSWLMLIGGLALVVLAARILVPAAAEIARRIGVPDDVIAATMVALGTSLPELVTAITSVRRGHPEIMVGNIVGADVLNCLFVIGASALARPLAVPPNFYFFHFPAMLLILYSFRAFVSLSRRDHFTKGQGAWLASVYAIYVVLQYTLAGRLHLA